MKHYGLTREEFASKAGKHPSCFSNRLRAACGNGDYHAATTRDESEVDCPACRKLRNLSPGWLVGVNMPGYMPDNPPDRFDTQDEAKRALISIIKCDEDMADTEEEAEELAAFAEDVNLESGEFGQTCGKYHYWITKE